MNKKTVEIASFIAGLIAIFAFLGYCLFPLFNNSLSKFDGSWATGFYPNAIHAFMSFSILFYAAISWKQKKFNRSLAVSVYSILFSYAY